MDDTNANFQITPKMHQYNEMLSNPKHWGEVFLTNRNGSKRLYRDYQTIDLCCPDSRIVHQDGRAVGKTVNLSTLLLWYTFVYRGKSVLVAAPYQGYLNTIIDEMEFQFHNNELLRNNISQGLKGPKIKRKPYYPIFTT